MEGVMILNLAINQVNSFYISILKICETNAAEVRQSAEMKMQLK